MSARMMNLLTFCPTSVFLQQLLEMFGSSVYNPEDKGAEGGDNIVPNTSDSALPWFTLYYSESESSVELWSCGV